MRTRISKLLCATLAAVPLAACHSHHSSGGTPPAQPATYSATLTGIDIDRTADQQPLPVSSLPVQGATLTVR